MAETQGPRPPGEADAKMSDLALGRKLTVVDLNDPEKPIVVQQIVSHERPMSVAVNPTGTTVMVAFAASSHSAVPLALFPFTKEGWALAQSRTYPATPERMVLQLSNLHLALK